MFLCWKPSKGRCMKLVSTLKGPKVRDDFDKLPSGPRVMPSSPGLKPSSLWVFQSCIAFQKSCLSKDYKALFHLRSTPSPGVFNIGAVSVTSLLSPLHQMLLGEHVSAPQHQAQCWPMGEVKGEMNKWSLAIEQGQGI